MEVIGAIFLFLSSLFAEEASEPVLPPQAAVEIQTQSPKYFEGGYESAYETAYEAAYEASYESYYQSSYEASYESLYRATSSCHPSYSGCLKQGVGDYDCRGGSGDGPNYTGAVSVYGYDEFGLDRDGDGRACE